MLIKSKTRPAGFEICPAECLVNTQQELNRGRLEPLEVFLTDGEVWDTGIKNVAQLFHGVTHEFVQEWGKSLMKMERENPQFPPILATEEKEASGPGREDMLLAINNETLKRRTLQYHKENQS